MFSVSTYADKQFTAGEISTIYKELENLLHVSPSYSLVVDERAEHSHSIDNDTGYYNIIIKKDELNSTILAHEMAHIFFFELLRKSNISSEEIPLWYHELVAMWFEQFMGSSSARILSFKCIFFNFTFFDTDYPQSEELELFYDSIGNFAEYLSKRYNFSSFVVESVEKYRYSGDLMASLDAVLKTEFDKVVMRWRLTELTPYFSFLLIVVIFIYLVLGRGDKRWRELKFDPKIPEDDL
ncbi:hypothetical protein [Kosmotoga pacifica]|uniref:hypothetical protein n=1 Tax=Kosmotoga pacifica TaxID=1330330 RepID=UPI002353779F|nr:hypothetical protein [Kosmotoga pacifica]